MIVPVSFVILAFLVEGHLGTRGCFVCSEIDNAADVIGCPLTTDDPEAWSAFAHRYRVFPPSPVEEVWCALGYSGQQGAVVYQDGISGTQCNDTNFQQTINSFVGPNPIFICCNKDGCNWSLETARKNWSIKEYYESQNRSLSSGSSTSGNGETETDVAPYIIIGLICVALVGCCFCYICISLAHRRQKQKSGFLSSLTAGFHNDLASEKSTRGGGSRVGVLRRPEYPGIEFLDPKDHERYSAMERRLYSYKRTDQGKEPSGTSNENRTRIINGAVHDPIGDRSKDLFDNSNFHQANKKLTTPADRKRARQRKWEDIWKNTGDVKQPKDFTEKVVNANPFRFADSIRN